MTPEFSRRAGQVLASPYFSIAPPQLPDADVGAYLDARAAEKDALERAVDAADSYDDLPAPEQAVWDKALDFGAGVAAQADLSDRLNG